MIYYFARHEVKWALEKVPLHNFWLASVVSDILGIYQLFADPCWASNIVKETIEFWFGENRVSWFDRLDLISSYEIIIVSILIKMELELLLNFKFVVDDWRTLLLTLEVYVATDQILSDEDCIQ